MNERVRHALAQMRRERAKITFAAVARRPDVSHTFLYQNDDARRAVEGAATEAAGQFTKDESAKAAQLDAAWRERALNAEELVKAMGDEVRSQRRQLATSLGRIRDLEGNLPADAARTPARAAHVGTRQAEHDGIRPGARSGGAGTSRRGVGRPVRPWMR